MLFVVNSIVLLTFLYIKRNIKRVKKGNKAPNTTTTKKGIKRTHPTPRIQNHTFYIVPHPQFCLISSFPSTTTTRTHAWRLIWRYLLLVCCRFAWNCWETPKVDKPINSKIDFEPKLRGISAFSLLSWWIVPHHRTKSEFWPFFRYKHKYIKNIYSLS